MIVLKALIWFYLFLYPHCEMRIRIGGLETDNATEFGPPGAMMDWSRTYALEKVPFVTVARCYDEERERLEGR